MSQARQVSPLDRDAEEKLVAVMEAVDGRLPRQQIWQRVCDDFASEEDLAKALGRLVANGRLVRDKRSNPRGGEEFVYGIPGRLDKIAAAVSKVQPPAPAVSAAVAAVPQPEKKPMSHPYGTTRQRVLDHFTVDRGWMAIGQLTKALDMEVNAVKYHLRPLIDDGVIKATGATNSRRYAHRDVEAPSPPAAERPPAKTVEQPSTARSRSNKSASRGGPSPNLAEFGAEPRQTMPVPMPANEPGRIAWAIEDSGMVAINDGEKTIRLAPADIAYGVDFLEKTQLIWKRAA